MIETLISSKTRVKLLLKFFLNPDNSAHLRGLGNEFGESTNAIRVELKRLEDANMLVSKNEGNKRLFRVNEKHPLYRDIHNIVRKYFGIDVIVDKVAQRLGNLEAVYLTGDIAKGRSSGNIELILVGDIDKQYLAQLTTKAENLIQRKISYTVEKMYDPTSNQNLLIWYR
jgi:hypothetical protein